METKMEGIASLLRGFRIVEDTPQDHLHGKEPLHSTPDHLASLQDAIQMLVQPTNTLTSQAQHFKSGKDDTRPCSEVPITEVYSLYEGAGKLANIIGKLSTAVDALNRATKSSVIKHLKSLGRQSAAGKHERRTTHELFAHFDDKIRNIIRGVPKKTSEANMFWKVAEECYKQVTSPSGSLHVDDYLDTLKEARLQRPYVPGFENEEHHGNRLNVDKYYATVLQAQTECIDQTCYKYRQNWVDFWCTALNNSPARPTLFCPTSVVNQSLPFNATPKYLFRTYDENSAGRNDSSVIGSIASAKRPPESSRIDFLELEHDEAVDLLYKHLKGHLVLGKRPNNLMSWTSSLPFAIQCATWRRRRSGSRPSDIKICAVDT